MARLTGLSIKRNYKPKIDIFGAIERSVFCTTNAWFLRQNTILLTCHELGKQHNMVAVLDLKLPIIKVKAPVDIERVIFR